eukprot:542291-Alexandrium_andersonii.AAC.1
MDLDRLNAVIQEAAGLHVAGICTVDPPTPAAPHQAFLRFTTATNAERALAELGHGEIPPLEGERGRPRYMEVRRASEREAAGLSLIHI